MTGAVAKPVRTHVCLDGLGGGVEKIPFQNTDVQRMAGVGSGSEDSRSSGCVAIIVLIPGRSRALFLTLAWKMGKGDRAKGEGRQVTFMQHPQ